MVVFFSFITPLSDSYEKLLEQFANCTVILSENKE